MQQAPPSFLLLSCSSLSKICAANAFPSTTRFEARVLEAPVFILSPKLRSQEFLQPSSSSHRNFLHSSATQRAYQVPATVADHPTTAVAPTQQRWKRGIYNIREMANGKYEYVKSFEVSEKLMPFTWIVVRIDGCHFRRFTEEHKFDKPSDIQGLNLMNACAVRVLQKFPDIQLCLEEDN